MSNPDYRPLDEEELAALEFFVASTIPSGMPSMIRRLIAEVRERRASSVHPIADGWPLDEFRDLALPDLFG